MPYKIAGTKNETSRIIIIDETDYSIEKTVLIEGSGEYEIEVTEGKKTILARLNTGETVGYGGVDAVEMLGAIISDGEVFNSGDTEHVSVAKLTDAKAIVCYTDAGNSDFGTACVLDISGSTITAGNECIFNNGNTQYGVSVTKLTDTKAIVCYTDTGNSGYGTSCVLDISGSTITAGDEHVFNNAATTRTSVTKLTDTKVIVCYNGYTGGFQGSARILNIDGATITAGSQRIFNSNDNTWYISVTALTSTKAIVCYRDHDGSNYRGVTCILDVSGSSISARSEYVFNNVDTRYISVTGLTDTKAIVCYQDYGGGGHGIINILDINSSIITVGDEYVFNSDWTDYISVTKITDTKVIVCYKYYYGDNYYGTTRVLNISGSTITAGDEHIFNNGSTYYISITALTNTEAVVCYKDVGNNDYGTAKLIYNL